MPTIMGCCTLITAIMAVILGVSVHWVMQKFPPQKVWNCEGNSPSKKYPTLDGYPYRCGWLQLRPELDTPIQVFAYIQPGSWCWNNAGLIAPRGGGYGGGVLIDTLMDGGLTERMLMSRPYGGGMGLSDLQALIFTHPDVDHTLGDVSVGRRVLRYGRQEVNQDLQNVRNSKMMMTIAARIGHYVWSLAEWARWRDRIAKLESKTRDTVLKVLGWAWFQSRISQFRLEDISAGRIIGVTEVLSKNETKIGGLAAVGTIIVRNFGSIHSHSDSMVCVVSKHTPFKINVPLQVFHSESKVVFTGDLLFVGIAPVMWAGPAQSWVDALDKLLASTDGGKGWLFVPGHGPVTNAIGVKLLRKYFEYIHASVEDMCDWQDKTKDLECAYKLLNGLPKDLRAYEEPQRIIISAQIECMAKRAGEPVSVDLLTKTRLLSGQGEYMVRKMVGLRKDKPKK